MNTAMSTKRFYIASSQDKEGWTGAHTAHYAFFIGLALLIIGIATEQVILAIPGFTAFVGALLYYNSAFWAKVMEKKGRDK